jgi:hypothetical protein
MERDTNTTLPPGPLPELRVMTLVSRNLTPTPVVYEKQLLLWQPENPGDSVTVTIPDGLCVEGPGTKTATYDQPVRCTIKKQELMPDDGSMPYTYTLSSAGAADPDGDVLVKRCIGCP